MFLKFRYGQKPKTWGLSGRVQEVFGWFFCSKRGKRMKQAETKTPSRIKNNMPCVFVHISFYLDIFSKKKQWLGPGSRCAFCVFQPPAPLWWANPCQSISTRRLRNIYSPRFNGTKINGGTRAKSRGLVGSLFWLGCTRKKQEEPAKPKFGSLSRALDLLEARNPGSK